MEKQLSPTEHNSLENRNKQQTNLVSKNNNKVCAFCKFSVIADCVLRR